MPSNAPQKKVTIVGSGIIGALTAYFVYLNAKANNEPVRVTMYDKNKNISETTAFNIFPSLTIDEMIAVLPAAKKLKEYLKVLFNQPNGIRVDDVKNVNDTAVANKFLEAVEGFGKDEAEINAKTQALLELGKMSMDLWSEIYDTADPELKKIMEEANFNPCREPHEAKPTLHDGYRADLIYNVPNAKATAEEMKAEYEKFGYRNCKILTPAELMAIDPSLEEFCRNNSEIEPTTGELKFKSTAVGIWRPGGCIDTSIFLPKFYDYLRKIMSQYKNEAGQFKDCFRLKFNREVVKAIYHQVPTATMALALDATTKAATDSSRPSAPKSSSTEVKSDPQASSQFIMTGLKFAKLDKPKSNKRDYKSSRYYIIPGENVGSTSKMGFQETPYAGFAGASLRLSIPLSAEDLAKYKDFNHCIEVRQEGIVLAWQARIIGDKVCLGVAGTKAFYADQTPQIEDAFVKDRNLKQLNMLNDVLPQFVSLALERDTRGKELTQADLDRLVDAKIARVWGGRRSVAADGFITAAHATVQASQTLPSPDFQKHLALTHTSAGDKPESKRTAVSSALVGPKVVNAVILGNWGSGGCSNAPSAAALGLYLFGSKVGHATSTKVMDNVLKRSTSIRAGG